MQIRAGMICSGSKSFTELPSYAQHRELTRALLHLYFMLALIASSDGVHKFARMTCHRAYGACQSSLLLVLHYA
jgi:hypothetical protein